MGVGPRQWRDWADIGGPIVDWNLMTTIDGLFAAGGQIFASGDHAYAACTGKYAGLKAAQHAGRVKESEADRHQVDLEKARVYAPVQRKNGMDWKELNAGVCKVMQDYCGELKTEELLKLGLKWFDEIEEGELGTAFARNPHELGRLLEVCNIITVGRIAMHGCRARKCTNPSLGFFRPDYAQVDPPEWDKWVTVKLVDGDVKTGELAKDYHGDMVRNYETHRIK
jgi:succinate dehydrogenase/fumarate reductase flavoprotein subunit